MSSLNSRDPRDLLCFVAEVTYVLVLVTWTGPNEHEFLKQQNSRGSSQELMTYESFWGWKKRLRLLFSLLPVNNSDQHRNQVWKISDHTRNTVRDQHNKSIKARALPLLLINKSHPSNWIPPSSVSFTLPLPQFCFYAVYFQVKPSDLSVTDIVGMCIYLTGSFGGCAGHRGGAGTDRSQWMMTLYKTTGRSNCPDCGSPAGRHRHTDKVETQPAEVTEKGSPAWRFDLFLALGINHGQH